LEKRLGHRQLAVLARKTFLCASFMLVSNIAGLNHRIMIATAPVLVISSLVLVGEYGLPKLDVFQHMAVLSYLALMVLFGGYLFASYHLDSFSIWLNRFGRIIVGLFAILGVLSLSTSKKSLHGFYKTIIAGATIAMLTSVFQLAMPDLWEQWTYSYASSIRLVSDYGQVGRAFGIWQNSLDFCFVLIVGSLAIVILQENKGFGRLSLLYLLLLSINAVLVVLSGSRSASVLLLVGVGLCLLYGKHRKQMCFAAAITVIIAALVITSAFFRGDAKKRLDVFASEGPTGYITGASTRTRIRIAQTCVNAMINGPVYGYGLGGYVVAIPRYWRPHNMYLEIGLQLGWAGLFLSVLMMFMSIFAAIKKKTGSLPICIFAAMTIFVGTMVMGHVIQVFWFHALMALILTLRYASSEPTRRIKFKFQMSNNS